MENEFRGSLKSAKEIFDKHAELYRQRFMDVSAYSKGLEYLCERLPMDAQVLEIACGPGNVTRFLLDNRPDLKILGTDISPKMIDLARVNIPTARFEVLDCREIKSLDHKFDVIVCGFCLPYLKPEETEQFFEDARETLVPKGLLYVSTICDDPSNSGIKTNSAGDKTMIYYYLENDLIQLLTRKGFKILDHHFVLRDNEKDVLIIAEI
jgi:trans-aconitate methyltransferase